ncbi:MAG: hypothetical protein DRN15_10440 [Thermoprotei archaeon]|nr:MAG: hypothetical protein DRN15_10440 [Thermoprotei archaeon]RLF24330.1 MAG: hypothetical protein DRM97_03555 [Thermoprotei archaeon]
MRFVLYVDVNSMIHRLDPRAKLYWVLCVFIWSMTFNHPIYAGMVLGIVLMTLILAKVIKEIKFAVTPLAILITMCITLWPLFRREGTIILFGLGFLKIYQEAVLYAIAVGLRLTAMVLAGIALLLTTRIEELEAALVRLKLPYPMAFGISAVFRFIPTLMGDAYMVIAAQRARGVDPLKGSLLTKMRNSAIIVAPIFMTSMRRLSTLPLAMESRGYIPTASRTYFIQLRMRATDYLYMVITTLLTIVFILMRLSGIGVVYPHYI